MLKKWSFFQNSGLSFNTLSTLFTLKFIVGISVFYVYTYYYTDRKTADIFKYFDDAKYLYKNVYLNSPVKFWKIILGIQNDASEIHNHLKETHYWFKPHASNVFNDNRTVIRFNAVIYLFSFGYYHVHTLVLSTLSFIGLTGIYRTFNSFFKEQKKELIIACFLIPSVLFWGSGILKESILIFGIGVFVFVLIQSLYFQKKKFYLIVIFITLGLLAITKAYVLLVIVPSIIAWVIIHFSKTKHIGLIFLIVNLGIILLAFNLKHFHSSLDLTGNIKYKQRDFINVARDTKAGSTIQLGQLDDSSWSYIKNIPQALFNGLLRPSIVEIKNIFFAFSALENMILLFLILLVFIFFKKPTKYQLPIIYFSLYFTLFLTILIGLTVPVLGAIVRYKIPFMPFIVALLLLCIDFKKLQQLIKQKKP